MRLFKCFFMISIIALLLLCSCNKGENDLKVKVSSPDETLIDVATHIDDESELSDIAKFNGSISELNAKYPVECVRVKGSTYRVSYLGNDSIAVILFDGYGDKIYGNVYNIQKKSSDFSVLTKGCSLEEVRKIDPNGEYLFLYTGRNDMPKLSSHCTKDGYFVTIEYNDSNMITNISEEFI